MKKLCSTVLLFSFYLNFETNIPKICKKKFRIKFNPVLLTLCFPVPQNIRKTIEKNLNSLIPCDKKYFIYLNINFETNFKYGSPNPS